MRTLTDCVIKPLAAFVLAAVVANCNDGCLPGYKVISPAEAYAMEKSGCVAKRNTKVASCANDAGSMKEYQECHEDAEEQYRICSEQVDRKYMGYNSEGGYPSGGQPSN